MHAPNEHPHLHAWAPTPPWPEHHACMHACTCQHMSVSACDSSAHEAHARTRHQPAPHRPPERRRNSSMSVDRGAEGHHGPDMTSFVCPITREVMRDPVITSDGQYRRSRIQTCPQQHQGSCVHPYSATQHLRYDRSDNTISQLQHQLQHCQCNIVQTEEKRNWIFHALTRGSLRQHTLKGPAHPMKRQSPHTFACEHVLN
jgi:hypothetical protein